MAGQLTDSSARLYARSAGVLYLLIIVFAGFAEGYVRGGLIVPGDAEATFRNIQAAEGLFRVGFVSDLLAFACDVGVTVLFYLLFRAASQPLSLLAAFLRLVMASVLGINLLNHFAALILLGGGDYLGAFGPGQVPALTLLYLEAHTVGYDIAMFFFGLHLLVLGHLIHRSGFLPPLLGFLAALAGVGYLLDVLASFLLPQYTDTTTWIVVVTAVVGELSLALWLTIRGVRVPA